MHRARRSRGYSRRSTALCRYVLPRPSTRRARRCRREIRRHLPAAPFRPMGTHPDYTPPLAPRTGTDARGAAPMRRSARVPRATGRRTPVHRGKKLRPKVRSGVAATPSHLRDFQGGPRAHGAGLCRLNAAGTRGRRGGDGADHLFALFQFSGEVSRQARGRSRRQRLNGFCVRVVRRPEVAVFLNIADVIYGTLTSFFSCIDGGSCEPPTAGSLIRTRSDKLIASGRAMEVEYAVEGVEVVDALAGRY